MQVRPSSLLLASLLAVMALTLLALSSTLLMAHQSESIHYVASDAATYFDLYESLYADAPLSETLTLLLVGSPILLMSLARGELLLVQTVNLLVMALTLRVALNCLPSGTSRISFLCAALLFPYFLFGFLSLNKEIYAMCSAIFFACYVVRGRLTHLAAALILAACARYYLLVALLVLLLLVPRQGSVRWGLVALTMLLISIAAPSVKEFVPGYSSEDVLEVSGVTGRLFSLAVDSYGYFLVYPLKYLVLIPSKAYGLFIGSDRLGDPMEAIVSLVSIVAFVTACRIAFRRGPRRAEPLVRRLVMTGLIAPLPLMWSEIMHWRYYSFVYFFFVFAIVLHRSGTTGHARAPVSAHA